MTDTVPTAMEAMGDFSGNSALIYDPATSVANPNFNAAKPVSKANPKVIRSPFPNNAIPTDRINPVASNFLMKYAPTPNLQNGSMAMGGMNMGRPGVVSGVGARIPTTTWTSGTNGTKRTRARFAWTTFSIAGTACSRVIRPAPRMASRRRTCRIWRNHDNLAQNGNITWSRIITPNAGEYCERCGFAAGDVSAIRRTTVQRHRVGNLASKAWALAGRGLMAHRTSMCKAIRVSATTIAGHADARVGHHSGGPR